MSDHPTVLVVAWRGAAPAAPEGWRAEPVLRDQSALDRAGSKGRTPPPFDAILWSDDPETALRPPDVLAAEVAAWSAFRVVSHPAWDDTAASGARPAIKQVSFLKARPELP
ncbi:MAG TPA: hypothetical protein VN180_08745, partial [Acidimicrobiia bacterium]|nr:hypothetical protein [Acidimicrobiia bacterium]